MKGQQTNGMMKPPARRAGSLRGVFREDPDVETGDEARVLMVVNVRRGTRRRLKLYATQHGTTRREIVERAILDYLDGHWGGAMRASAGERCPPDRLTRYITNYIS